MGIGFRTVVYSLCLTHLHQYLISCYSLFFFRMQIIIINIVIILLFCDIRQARQFIHLFNLRQTESLSMNWNRLAYSIAPLALHFIYQKLMNLWVLDKWRMKACFCILCRPHCPYPCHSFKLPNDEQLLH